jgi:hypothetical protein
MKGDSVGDALLLSSSGTTSLNPIRLVNLAVRALDE